MSDPDSGQLELRQQLLAERFGPVAALVLERVLTAAERWHTDIDTRRCPPRLSDPAGMVWSPRGRPTG